MNSFLMDEIYALNEHPDHSACKGDMTYYNYDHTIADVSMD